MIDRVKLHEMQTKFVIDYLMKDKGLSLGDAAKIWYNSKTKQLLHDTDIDYSFVAPTRCYDELLMELSNNPHWMKGQFE